MVARVVLTAVFIAICWVGSVSCYKLELDDAVKNDMRNLTCESYCTHCNCAGTFLEQENKCICSCDEHSPPDPSCLAEIEEMRHLIGLDYAIEVQLVTAAEKHDLEPHVRVSRQTNSRRRTRNRRQRTGGRRSRGRRPRRSRPGRRPGRTNLVGASAPTPTPPDVVAAPAPDV